MERSFPVLGRTRAAKIDKGAGLRILLVNLLEMRRDEMGWDGIGCDGMEQDGMEWDGME